MIAGRNMSPFTASQWQELEHQALVFKYMMSGLPIPPELILPIRRSFDPISSRLFPHPSVGWGCYQMGFCRKADPEPGRCRRTDGKKWRCSKEAFPDSKYCERHMHRGKNRSRKPVEISSSQLKISNPSSQPCHPSSSSVASQTRHTPYHSSSLHHFLYPHSSSSSRPPDTEFSLQNSTTHFSLGSGSFSNADQDYRYLHGLKERVDEHPFFSEASGTLRGLSDSLAPPRMPFSNALKQRNCSVSPSNYSQLQMRNVSDIAQQHCFVLGNDLKSGEQSKVEREGETRKFFDELPKNRDSWINLGQERSNWDSISNTQLSISIPIASDFQAGKSQPLHGA